MLAVGDGLSNINVLFLFLAISAHSFAQHDPGRNAVRLLAADQIEEALLLLDKAPKANNSPISQGEKLLVKAMAACRVENGIEAFKHAKRAVELGVPIERFQAGADEMFASLLDLSQYTEWLKPRGKHVLHGPMLGVVTDSSAQFWVRTADEADIRIELTPVRVSAGVTKVSVGSSRTSSSMDYTTVITIGGLEPTTQYRYTVWADNRRLDSTAIFQTQPQREKACSFSIAFGGGAGLTPVNERMWTTISNHQPNALLMLGDNVYIDDPLHVLTQRYCYYRRQSQPEWRELVTSTPVYAIYDDHDFGTNDCIPGSAVEVPAWKRQVLEGFKQNWNNPAYGGGKEYPGCWFDFHIGQVHFIMLDGRYYRDLKDGSMLGARQKTYLFKTLETSKAKFKILASPVPWSLGVKPGSKDTWDGFPAEREEIFAFIEEKAIDGVVLMAADRHRSDLRRITRPGGYDLYEVMSSRLTNVHTHDLLQSAKGSKFIMGYNEKCSFGLLNFDTTKDDPEVEYSIVSIDDEVIDRRVIRLSQLSHTN